MPNLRLHAAPEVEEHDAIPFPMQCGPTRLRLAGGDERVEAVEEAFARLQQGLDELTGLLAECGDDRPTAA